MMTQTPGSFSSFLGGIRFLKPFSFTEKFQKNSSYQGAIAPLFFVSLVRPKPKQPLMPILFPGRGTSGFYSSLNLVSVSLVPSKRLS